MGINLSYLRPYFGGFCEASLLFLVRHSRAYSRLWWVFFELGPDTERYAGSIPYPAGLVAARFQDECIRHDG
jgi:hypothetical protein